MTASTTATINEYTEPRRCDAKISMYFFTHRKREHTEPKTANRTRDGASELRPIVPTETENEQKIRFFYCCCCYFSSFRCFCCVVVALCLLYVSFRTRTRLYVVAHVVGFLLLLSITRKPTNSNTYMCSISSGTAQQNDTYAHKMTDFIQTLLVVLGLVVERKEQTPKPIKNASCYIAFFRFYLCLKVSCNVFFFLCLSAFQFPKC